MLEAIIAGISDGAVFGLMAIGLVLVYKATRVLNFGQGEIGTFSLYIAFVASSSWGDTVGGFGPIPLIFPWTIPIKGLGLPVVLAVLLAIVAAAGMGMLMERIAIRPIFDAPRVTLTIVTLGVATILGGLQFALFAEQPREMPALISGNLNLGGVFVQPGRILAIVVTVGLGLGLYVFFKRTMFGLGVLAAAQNATSLRLSGMSLARVSMFTWAAGGALAALAGVILAPTIGAFHPFFLTLLLVPSLAAALVGGMTSLPGAFLGGIAVGIAQNVARYVWGSSVPGVEIGAAFALILAVLLLRPQGLLGSEA